MTNTQTDNKVRTGFSIAEAHLEDLNQLSDELGVDRSAVLRLLLTDYFHLLEAEDSWNKYSPDERLEAWLSFYANRLKNKPHCNIYNRENNSENTAVKDTRGQNTGFSRTRPQNDKYDNSQL